MAGDSWGILFSTQDFTPVCTTELGAMAGLKSGFERRNIKILGLSVDPVSDHARWAQDIEDVTGHAPNYPLVGDSDLTVAKLYGMLPADAGSTSQGRTAATNQTVRSVFVIDPGEENPPPSHLSDGDGTQLPGDFAGDRSLQLTDKHRVATPANWKPGDDVIIAGGVSDEEARQKFPEGWKALKPYVRVVPQPRG